MACSAATFVASVTTWRALERSQESLYDVFLFPHVFAEVRRAPEGLARSAAALPGVAEVETRVLSEAVVDVPGLGEPASAMLRSLPPGGEPRLDRLHVREGRLPAPGESSAVLVSEGFARANRLGPGDRISAVVNGRWKSLRVVGIGGSPEHLFAVRPGTLLNDDRHYGVIWMARDELAAALDLTGAFNSIALRLAPGAREAPAIEGLDRLLAPYGNRGAYGRDRQISNRLVTDEIGQMRALASTVPVVMLGVASFLLAIVLSRLVATQRMQIGTLKALGYGNARVGVHYLAFAALLVAGGVVAGVAGGYGLGRWLSGVYARYYRFPAILYEAEPGVGILAAALALAVALAAASGAVRRAVRLAPAEAMRPGAPPTFRPSPLERLGLGRVLSARGRMVLRDLGRRPVRTALSAPGIARGGGLHDGGGLHPRRLLDARGARVRPGRAGGRRRPLHRGPPGGRAARVARAARGGPGRGIPQRSGRAPVRPSQPPDRAARPRPRRQSSSDSRPERRGRGGAAGRARPQPPSGRSTGRAGRRSGPGGGAGGKAPGRRRPGGSPRRRHRRRAGGDGAIRPGPDRRGRAAPLGRLSADRRGGHRRPERPAAPAAQGGGDRAHRGDPGGGGARCWTTAWSGSRTSSPSSRC